MAITISTVRETVPGERRVALTPDVAKKLKAKAVNLLIEHDAGAAASFPDAVYKDTEIGGDANGVLARSDVLLKVQPPSVGEIATKLEIEPAEVLEVLEANHNRRPLSLDRPVGGEEDESPASEWVGDEDEGYELIDDKLALEGVLPQLDDRERLILRLRFVDDMTQSQIAEQIGHSQMHVSRILRRTLDRIRAEVAEQRDAAEASD